MSLNQPAATKTSHPHGEIPLKTMGGNDGQNRQTLSFSGNGYYLASGSRDGVVKPGLPKGRLVPLLGGFVFNGKKCGIFGNEM